LALVILSSNHWPTLRRIAARIATAVDFVQTGQIVRVDVESRAVSIGKIPVRLCHIERRNGWMYNCKWPRGQDGNLDHETDTSRESALLRSCRLPAGWTGSRMRALRVLVVLSLVAVQIAAQSAAQVLARLDDVAPKFRTATAKVTWIDYQAAIKTEETQSGTITVKRYSRTKVHYVVRLADPDVYGVALRDNTVERYTPRNNLIQEYDIRRYRDLVQRFMLLGFGMTGR
jgi:hypothetical protein